MAKKNKAQEIAEIPIEEIAKLSKEQLIPYVKSLRYGYTRRVSSFKKKDLISHAQIAFEQSLTTKKPVQLTKLSRNQLLMEFARYSKFFKDKTSSEEGIKEVNREQDIRIFGADEKGNPLMTMTTQQRMDYWSAYEEFKNQYPQYAGQPYSESVQQSLADAVFDSKSQSFTDLLANAKKRLEQKQEEVNLRSVPNVYSGRGTTF